MMKAALLLAITVATFSPTMAWADQPQGTPQEQAACRPDVRKLCASVKPGSGNAAYLSCLVARRDRLSQACLTVLQNHNIL